MSIRDIVVDSVTNLSANLLRSGLTMLGVIIGVASVIALIAIVDGGKIWAVRSIERLGTNLLIVKNKRLTIEERREFAHRSTYLRHGDAVAIRQRFPEFLVVPRIKVDKQLKAGDRDFSGSLMGTTPEYQIVRNFRPAVGRFLDRTDIDQWRRVAVLGKEAAEHLFEGNSPVGQEVKIGGQRFTIIGVMSPKGDVMGKNYDQMIFIPVTTVMRRFQGDDRLDSMLIHIPRRESMDAAAESIHSILVQRHDGVDDVRIRNQGDFLRALERVIWTFRIVLGGIALVALMVGGIGIMNIMLVTVTERTSEIGLRKAVGARRGEILLQFLVEAVVISLLGGIIGIVLGVLFTFGFDRLVAGALPGAGDWAAVVRWSAVAIAFMSAVSVGIIFGLYPAIKASKLDPADALRYQ